jgi:hypothetical protein
MGRQDLRGVFYFRVQMAAIFDFLQPLQFLSLKVRESGSLTD